MKKFLSVLFAMLLVLITVSALAEEPVKIEIFDLGDGITFGAPADWTYLDIDDEMSAKGNYIMAVEQDTGLVFVARIVEVPKGNTAQDVAQIFMEDERYAKVEVITNELGQELVTYQSADADTLGVVIVGTSGFADMFIYSTINDTEPVLPNPRQLELYNNVLPTINFGGAK